MRYRRDRDFELVIMTGHAFQVLLTDDDIREAFASVKSAMQPGGRFVFETRNQATRPWERWTPDHVRTVTDDLGIEVRVERRVTMPFDGEVVTFTETFTSNQGNEPVVSESTLRFVDEEELAILLDESGLTICAQFGHWDRRPTGVDAPEIITVATV